MIDRQTIHLHDLATEPKDDLPAPHARSLGVRTILATPLLRDGIPIGAIMIRRMEVRPFSEKQIALLKTFADQAVIAIENVRLFHELQVRNRDLSEALEQQTATSEILGVIASSPTDIQPVLDAIAVSAARLCDSIDAVIYRPDGDVLQPIAIFGSIPMRSTPLPFSRGSTVGRAAVERQTIHIHDIEAVSETDFPEIDKTGSRGGSRAEQRLAVPLLREGIPLGAILIRRQEVRPFSDKQIKLLETFADQAVIAIENVRLFKELEETGILRASDRDRGGARHHQPLAHRRAASPRRHCESAARVCGIDEISIRLVEGDLLTAPTSGQSLAGGARRPSTRGSNRNGALGCDSQSTERLLGRRLVRSETARPRRADITRC